MYYMYFSNLILHEWNLILFRETDFSDNLLNFCGICFKKRMKIRFLFHFYVHLNCALLEAK